MAIVDWFFGNGEAGSVSSHAKQARLLFDERQYEKAIEHFSACIEKNHELAWSLTMRGLCHHYIGETAKAVEDYDRALTSDPSSAWAFDCRGSALFSMGDFVSAIKDFDEAIRLDPEHATPFSIEAESRLNWTIWKVRFPI